MSEILLSIICILILVYHAYYVRESNKEKKQLVDAVIAKNSSELRDLRVAENTKIKIEPTQPDLIPTEMLDDETLLKAENNYE
jgi:hypothetical protein